MTITIRLATIDDAQILARHRVLMFAEMGTGTEEGRTIMEKAFAEWVTQKLNQGAYFSWLACEGENIVAGAGLLLMDWPPSPFGDVVPRAYVYNVYTEVEYRRRGLARDLMQEIITFCRTKGYVDIRLHASVAGRPIYEGLGFSATNEMHLSLR